MCPKVQKFACSSRMDTSVVPKKEKEKGTDRIAGALKVKVIIAHMNRSRCVLEICKRWDIAFSSGFSFPPKQ